MALISNNFTMSYTHAYTVSVASTYKVIQISAPSVAPRIVSCEQKWLNQTVIVPTPVWIIFFVPSLLLFQGGTSFLISSGFL